MERPLHASLPSRAPRIGGMATMPSRRDSLALALPGILAQVDRLYLYLDRHDHIPAELAAQEKIVPILPTPQTERLRGSGKFLGLQAFGAPCLYYCFDDDILYPDGYVDHMASALHRHRYRVLLGVHASVFTFPMRSYVRSRRVAHFAAPTPVDTWADELGTGTLAFHSACIRIEPSRWDRPNKADLMMTLEALRQDVPMVAVRRPEKFLRAIAENQPDSLFRRVLADDSIETRILGAAIRLYPGRWALS